MHRCGIVFLTALILCAQIVWGAPAKPIKPTVTPRALIIDAVHRININSLDMFVSNFGNFAYDKTASMGRNDGLYYPRGTNLHCIYGAGIWIGAKIGGQTRVTLAEYTSEYTPGPMQNGTYIPDQPAFKVYEINRGDNSESNSDWANWPVDQGAPLDSTGNPLVLGDQMTWSVCNDADPSKHTNAAGSTVPLGVEIRQSSYAFARAGALGNVIYMNFKIFNKGGNLLDSTFVSFWFDPDLGEASDDLVGCDSANLLGYCYNSGADNLYGIAPPAVGLMFLQGPMVPGGAGDTAAFFGRKYPGHRNLSMTSFNRYVNGTDPDNPTATYNYMKGLNRDGSTVINPMNGQPTKFVASGDPVTVTGWLDGTPADKRMMLNAGPFTMMPGDSQEVVVAVLVGQGQDPIGSVSVLKQNAEFVRELYGSSDINSTMPSPSVYLRPGNGSVDIVWGSEPVGYVNDFPFGVVRFEFEGFNLFQGETINGPWHKFATYDLVNDVALIYKDVYDPEHGGYERVIVQSGSNSGIRFDKTVAASQIDGAPLVNGQPYFFAVTAYSYDHLNITPLLD